MITFTNPSNFCDYYHIEENFAVLNVHRDIFLAKIVCENVCLSFAS